MFQIPAICFRDRCSVFSAVPTKCIRKSSRCFLTRLRRAASFFLSALLGSKRKALQGSCNKAPKRLQETAPSDLEFRNSFPRSGYTGRGFPGTSQGSQSRRGRGSLVFSSSRKSPKALYFVQPLGGATRNPNKTRFPEGVSSISFISASISSPILPSATSRTRKSLYIGPPKMNSL